MEPKEKKRHFIVAFAFESPTVKSYFTMTLTFVNPALFPSRLRLIETGNNALQSEGIDTALGTMCPLSISEVSEADVAAWNGPLGEEPFSERIVLKED